MAFWVADWDMTGNFLFFSRQLTLESSKFTLQDSPRDSKRPCRTIRLARPSIHLVRRRADCIGA